ncbi:MAG: hypothetical protein J0I06_25565 [Planctomycetes bacterium]|nr:hypothetical protein [Planctomycetota bacterium]
MGVRFSIDRRERLVSYVVEGGATQTEAHAFFDAVLAAPDYRCGFDFLGDRRGAGAESDPSYVYAVAAEVLAHAAVLGPCRWAVVVADDDAHRRALTWAALAAPSGVEIRPFRTADEAAGWLGLPGGYAPAARHVAPPLPVPVVPPAVAGVTHDGQGVTRAEEHLALVACSAGSEAVR